MSKKTINEMTAFEESRWYALMEAIDIIEQGCKQHKTNFEKIKLSPIDIEKYINSTYNVFISKIESENPNIRMILENMDPVVPASTTLDKPLDDDFVEADNERDPEIVDDNFISQE